jgi:hypothetical protein
MHTVVDHLANPKVPHAATDPTPAADPEMARSHSRPRNGRDHPYSEAQFETMKYRPDFPPRFGSLQDALGFVRGFFRAYNHDHRRSGIAWLTPAAVHCGRNEHALMPRQRVLDAAFDTHPSVSDAGVPRCRNSQKSPPCPCRAPRSMKTPRVRRIRRMGRGALLRSFARWCGTDVQSPKKSLTHNP